MDLFTAYQQINDLYEDGGKDKENEARQRLIQVLDEHQKNNIPYNPIINHLIRKSGLYPYIKLDTALWEDRIVYEAFKVNIGKKEPVPLHIKQSKILKSLLEGTSIVLSAPTSFGKSFIIDSFIAIKKPDNVVIIVPTIALTDETRRRLQNKFSDEYKIITNTDVAVSEKNIFIFTQERAINYIEKINCIDLLIIDEFYKADPLFEKERAPILMRALLQLDKKTKQKYFLAPNIKSIDDNLFTKNMTFIPLDYNTVFLKKIEMYKEINTDKGAILEKLLKEHPQKTLIYAGSYAEIDNVANIIIELPKNTKSDLLLSFRQWLIKNYGKNLKLTKLIKKEIGIHNSNIHRALAQIQICLFEEKNGLQRIISTSSIIEGINTSAQNVIIWYNKTGRSYLNDFTYKNIIGRSGRMFRHFIGNIFILAKPPVQEDAKMTLAPPNSVIEYIDQNTYKDYVKEKQIDEIKEYNNELLSILGKEKYNKLKNELLLQTTDIKIILKIVQEISNNQNYWLNLNILNSKNTKYWDVMLKKLMNLIPYRWIVQDIKKGMKITYVDIIKIFSDNWSLSFPELFKKFKQYKGMNTDLVFRFERRVALKFTPVFRDINTLQKLIIEDESIDISPFLARVSHAFLPKIVYQLEEYGLPRMISKKIHNSQIIDLENNDQEINEVINTFIEIGIAKINEIETLDDFDKYIIKYFYEGIMLKKE